MEHYTGKDAKSLLKWEIIFGIFCISVALLNILISAFVIEKGALEVYIGIISIVITFLFMIITCLFLLKIEQRLGYHLCKNCGHKYIPTYKKLLFAPHIHLDRYMECPKCKKKSWHKKVLD